ncbi:beta-1,3-galactosyltransferase 5 [Helicoverpa armigera]|uniref:beta-1,3-galactosyltransferase 5 n=1 Tax=Helicoverpa armigera TaxID=29058 RepID=UPI0030837EFA
MFHLATRIIVRKFLVLIKLIGRRKSPFLFLPLLVSLLVLWPTIWWFAEQTSQTLMVPPPLEHALDHYRRNRSLHHYLSNIQTLIEPSWTPCESLDEVPVVVLVTSSPHNLANRQAVRETWAKHQPTYFVMGLIGNDVDDQLVDSYIEAKQFGDLLVFDFHDHYQNLTLKTALMMKWTLRRCPQAQFMFKTDDDVLVNPWMLKKVIKENGDASLLGYSINGTQLNRSEYSKWFIPRWLLSDDRVSKYLSGTGYLISGDYIEAILKKAYNIPIVNLEDVYFTYLVAHKQLGLVLTHDRRLSPYKPWLKTSCLYWEFASIHSLSPDEMVSSWSRLKRLVDRGNGTSECWFFESYLGDYSDVVLY